MATRLQAIIDFAYKGGGIQQATSDLGKLQGKGKETEESFGKLGAGFKSAAVAGVAFAGVVGGALAAGLAKTVMAASDAEESLSKFNVVFDKLEGGPDGLAKEVDRLAEATGRSKYELIGAVGALGDLFQPLGFSTEAAADLSLKMTQLAIDLSSFNNMPMDEALQRLQGTLVGSHENALAFGVVINENTLKAQMMADGTDKLTGAQFEQAKVQARLNLLMAGTTAAQGDAIRTADGFANQVKALQGEMKDLSVELGQKFLPAAIEAIGAIREMATDAIPALVAAAETAGPALLSLVKGGIEQVSLAASTVNLNNLYNQLKDLGLGTADLSNILGDSRAQFDLWRTDADMADDLARNEAGVRKLNYAIIGLEMGLSNVPSTVGTVANGFRSGTSELEDFVVAMEAMNLGLPVAATGMEYWTLATRKVADAIIEADEAVTVATVDTSLLAIDVIHATNVFEDMKPAVQGVTGAIYASSEAVAAYNANLGKLYMQARQTEDAELLLNSGIRQTSGSLREVSNLTDQQTDDLERMESAYDKAAGTIRDYELGVKGANLTDDERNEKIAEQQQIMATLAANMEPLIAAGSQWVAVQGQMVSFGPAVADAFLQSGEAIGMNSTQLAGLELAFSDMTEAGAEAMIKEALLREEITRLTEEVKNKNLTIYEARDAYIAFQEGLNNSTIAVNDTTGSVLLMNDSMVSSATTTQNLLDKFGLFPDEVGTKVTVDTAEAESRLSSLEARLAGLGSGGQPATASGGNQSSPDLPGQGFASGADFIVPPGYPNDSYPMRVQSGERVTVTPAGQSSGGDTYNLYVTAMDGGANIAREFNYLRSLAGA